MKFSNSIQPTSIQAGTAARRILFSISLGISLSIMQVANAIPM